MKSIEERHWARLCLQARRRTDQGLVVDSDGSAIKKDSLDDCNIGAVDDDASHDGDTDMLFDWKRARIEGPYITEIVVMGVGRTLSRALFRGKDGDWSTTSDI